MRIILSIVLALIALHLVSANVIRDEETTTSQSAEQPSPPQSLKAPPLKSQTSTGQTTPPAEHENTVVAHVQEHTEEHNDHVDKVDGYNPDDGKHESYEVTPEEKLHSEFADTPNAEDENTADQASTADASAPKPSTSTSATEPATSSAEDTPMEKKTGSSATSK